MCISVHSDMCTVHQLHQQWKSKLHSSQTLGFPWPLRRQRTLKSSNISHVPYIHGARWENMQMYNIEKVALVHEDVKS